MAAAPHIEIEVDGRAVRVSNPDKVYFPAVGVTKRELVEHYVAVGTAITHALYERPTYLERFPDGIEGEQVYQKRFPKYAPDWVRTARITFPSGRSADALCVTSPADVAWEHLGGEEDEHAQQQQRDQPVQRAPENEPSDGVAPSAAAGLGGDARPPQVVADRHHVPAPSSAPVPTHRRAL